MRPVRAALAVPLGHDGAVFETAPAAFTCALITSGWTYWSRASRRRSVLTREPRSYWSGIVGDEVLDDVAWSYEDAFPELARIRGLLCFDEKKVMVSHDLPRESQAAAIDSLLASPRTSRWAGSTQRRQISEMSHT